MKKNYILDCTLRDGGYVNDWKFGKDTIKGIVDRIDKAKIDFIECGFLTECIYDEKVSLFNSMDQVNNILPQNINSIPVVMIACGEKEINIDKLEECKTNRTQGIRLSFHKHEISHALKLATEILCKGYLLFMQPIGIISYTDKELLDLIEKVNAINPYAFYIVDTLGALYGTELLHFFQLIEKNLGMDIHIGFHSHNNLQLSFSNALTLLNMNSKHELIIDSSMLGIGRGAGNLCTELITQYINENLEIKYNVMPIMEAIDAYISPLKEKYQWGYSIPYFIAATNQCHPNYASYLINKQTINMGDIEKIIVDIPKDKRHIFDKEYIAEKYKAYQNNYIDDAMAVSLLKKALVDKKILLLAPGKSLSSQKEKIEQYIQDEKPFIISINSNIEIYDADAVFVSNIKRLERIKVTKKIKIIATSNVNPQNMHIDFLFNYVDYLNLDRDICDDAGTMLIKILKKCDVRRIALAGFDGYSNVYEDNYYSKDLYVKCDRETYENKNKKVGEVFKNLQKELDILFITNTRYKI